MPKVKALGTQQKAKQDAAKKLKANLAYYATLHGFDNHELTTISGISVATFYHRLQDPTAFRLIELIRIAQAFKIPVTRLLGEDDNPDSMKGSESQ